VFRSKLCGNSRTALFAYKVIKQTLINKNQAKSMPKLVNEKTLELNITHEGLSSVGIGVVGFTQQQESRIGADVFFPGVRPFVIQYKAAKEGFDNSAATFQVNNNKRMNQHRALDAIARSGLCEAYYSFPLIVSNSFLASNFGRLLDFTIMVDAQRLTGSLNWHRETHSVEVQANGLFVVNSEGKVTGKGFSAKQFFERKANEKEQQPYKGENLADYMNTVIEKIEHVVREAEILGHSEHTITFIGTDKERKRLGYLQLPILIHGLEKKPDKSA
jgi:hypothetical protein